MIKTRSGATNLAAGKLPARGGRQRVVFREQPRHLSCMFELSRVLIIFRIAIQ